MKLHFDVALCVRATSKFSTCTKCVDASPESIQIVEHLPTFVKATGVEAAACVGACPTEAFSLSDFSVTEFFFRFLESKVRLISSKVNIPCLSVLSVEHLISLALASQEPIALDLNGYEEETQLFDLIEARIEEANFILSSFSDKALLTNHETTVDKEVLEEERLSSRRDFLSSASLKGVMKHKKAFDDAVEAEELEAYELDASMITKIKDKYLPNKRKILLTTMKHAGVPKSFEVLPQEEVSFVSQKFVDESCTNCQICYRICPTGALSSNGKFSLINFDAMLCVKCYLCHDACEPDSIHLQPGFEVKEFFEASQRTLAKFDVRRCNECGNNFTYTGGEQACPRCMVEEEEAMFLHDNAKRMKSVSSEQLADSSEIKKDER
jgi:ferredoxin